MAIGRQLRIRGRYMLLLFRDTAIKKIGPGLIGSDAVLEKWTLHVAYYFMIVVLVDS